MINKCLGSVKLIRQFCKYFILLIGDCVSSYQILIKMWHMCDLSEFTKGDNG